MLKQEFLKEFRKYFLWGSGEWFIKFYKKASQSLDKGTIIDIETTGLNPGKGNLYIPASHIITLGIYQGDLIRIYQLTKRNYVGFLNICRKIVEKTPKPRYAYAAHFEQSFLGVIDGWHDLTQYYYDRQSDWYGTDDFEPPYRRQRLADVTRNPSENREDWDIDGSEIPATWEKWLQTRNSLTLAEIPYHCYIDMLRERQLI